MSAFVPGRLRADWRREWEAELAHDEEQSKKWRQPGKTRWLLIRHSLGSSWDALSLQRRRLEDDLVQDARHGVRLATRSPGMALAACLSIAAGIGGSTAAFTLVDAAVLRQWPYPHADRLVVLSTNITQYFSIPAFRRLLDTDAGLDHVTAAEAHGFVVDLAGRPTLVNGHRVSPEAVALLGLDGPLRPRPGRPFLAADFETRSDPVVLISHRLWRQWFASSDAVPGRSLKIDGQPARIIGVLPPEFDFFPNGDILAPLSLSGPGAYKEFDRTLEVFGSLRPGVQASSVAWWLTSATRRFRPAQTAIVDSVRARLFRGFGPTIRILTLVSLVILIVCGLNFATLLMVRSADRRQEFAVRMALGAGRARIVRQLVTEALVLSFAGGAAGALIAQVGRGTFIGTATGGIVNPASGLDWKAFTFASLLTLGTGLLFSVGPARRATATLDLDVALKGGAPRWFASNWLAGAVQLALTMVLLVGAGLLVKSLARIQAFDSGYDSADAVTLRFDLPPSRYPTDADIARFVGETTGRLGTVPGVESVGAASSLPYAAGALHMSMVSFEQPVRVSGPPEAMPLGWRVPPPPPPPPGMGGAPAIEFFPALSCEVGTSYFRAMGIPLRSGREFTSFDSARSTRVVVINQRMADRYWSGVDPIGRRLRLGPLYPWQTIVGVVGNIRRFAQDDAVRSEYYEPFAQAGDQRQVWSLLGGLPSMPGLPDATPSPVMLVVRSRLGPRAVSSAAGDVLREVDPSLPIVKVSTLRDALDHAIAKRRFLLRNVLAFAGLALLLAVVGVYAVTAQVVRRRTRELSIRAALGAGGGHLMWLAIRDGLVVTGIGGCLGLLISALFTPQLGTFLYDVSPWDWRTFLAVTLILTPVVICAACVPARQAARVDPLVALKSAVS
ncbi:MAG TPA: ABC transporter permease [Vicinamibacterales bacterium]|nr:ABC transporter permease [Vicinamibacterales bacterium]